MATLLRAAKKNNYMVLKNDQCEEIDAISMVLPRILEFENYIHKKRFKHKCNYEMQRNERMVQRGKHLSTYGTELRSEMTSYEPRYTVNE